MPDDAGLRYIRSLMARPEAKIPGQKLGLYPLGDDDVIMSRPLYELVIQLLEKGTPESQLEVARMMRKCERAPYQPT